MSEQKMPAWKHSQYFFRHVLFLQLQPFVWRGTPSAVTRALNSASLPWIFGRNALGLRSRMASTALCRVPSCSLLFMQLTQLHESQYRPDAKHSQYSLRHREFLQLHCFRAEPPERPPPPALAGLGIGTLPAPKNDGCPTAGRPATLPCIAGPAPALPNSPSCCASAAAFAALPAPPSACCPSGPPAAAALPRAGSMPRPTASVALLPSARAVGALER
mmetsp:Transcript_25271/g.74640  ORF Transcript_25271/g.74640 Transcript_25271/m.74640 type:complete len:218 (-) Transcript_25271:98-751(-)